MLRLKAAAVGAGIAVVAASLAITSPGAAQSRVQGASVLPHYDHVVLAIFENHEQSQIIGSSNAPYLTSLSTQGANFTQAYAIEHPSQPNYLDLFSGSNQGVTDDNPPPALFNTDNIGHQMIAAGRTFAGYAEGLPAAGSTVWTNPATDYARRHVPWTDFADLDQNTVDLPYSSFPTDFTKLPTLSWVVPNLCDDMHDCAVSSGDTWSQQHLDAYAQWAKTHNSLLIVTFDEDDTHGTNQIATLFIGDHIKPGNYDEHIDHFTVLRTIEALYGLPAIGSAADRTAITDVFTTPAPPAPSNFVVARKPRITGMTIQGHRLTAHRAVLRPGATRITYQWLRNGHAIRHATRATYVLVRADRRARISLRETATRPGYKPLRLTVTEKSRVRAR